MSFSRGPIKLIGPASCDPVGFTGGDSHMATTVKCRNNIRKVKETSEKKIEPPQKHSTAETPRRMERARTSCWAVMETD